MKNAFTLIAVAGIASASTAQTGSLSIVPSAMTVDSTTTTSFTLSVYGDADFGTAIAAGRFSLSAVGGAGIVTDMSFSVVDWATLLEDQGHAGDGNYADVAFGQLVFPPFFPPADDSLLGDEPVYLGSFAVTIAADSIGVIDWSTGGGDGDTVMEIFTDIGGGGFFFTQLTELEMNFGGASVNVVPAPSAMALLGLGGLVAGRRRRESLRTDHLG